jgi:general secretion pathway protein H
MRRTRPAAGGFTLVEMTVVLLIIALGVALVVPLIEGGFTSRAVRRAARQLAATFHHCRGEAVARGEPQQVMIDPLRNGLYATDFPRWAALSDRAVIERVDGGVRVPSGAVRVACFPNGSTSGVAVLLASRRDRTRNRLWVRLDPLLGTVRVEDASR